MKTLGSPVSSVSICSDHRPHCGSTTWVYRPGRVQALQEPAQLQQTLYCSSSSRVVGRMLQSEGADSAGAAGAEGALPMLLELSDEG